MNGSKKEILDGIRSPRPDGCTDPFLVQQPLQLGDFGAVPLCPEEAAEEQVSPQVALWLGFRGRALNLTLNSASLILLVYIVLLPY